MEGMSQEEEVEYLDNLLDYIKQVKEKALFLLLAEENPQASADDASKNRNCDDKWLGV